MSSSIRVTIPSSSSWSVALAGKNSPTPDKSRVCVAGIVSGRGTPPLGGSRPIGFEKGSWLVTLVVEGLDMDDEGWVTLRTFLIRNVILWWL